MTRIAGIGCVRNSVDIAPWTYAYLLAQGVDDLIICDDDSTDGMSWVLRRLAKRTGRVHWLRYRGTTFDQVSKTAAALEVARKRGADVIFTVDADECIWSREKNLRDALAQAREQSLIVQVVNFVQPRSARFSSPFGVFRATRRASMQERREDVLSGRSGFVDAEFPPKMVAPARPDLSFSKGGHIASYEGQTVREAPDVEILHLPLRSMQSLAQRGRQEPRQAMYRSNVHDNWQSLHFRQALGSGALCAQWEINSVGDSAKPGFVPDRRWQEAMQVAHQYLRRTDPLLFIAVILLTCKARIGEQIRCIVDRWAASGMAAWRSRSSNRE